MSDATNEPLFDATGLPTPVFTGAVEEPVDDTPSEKEGVNSATGPESEPVQKTSTVEEPVPETFTDDTGARATLPLPQKNDVRLESVSQSSVAVLRETPREAMANAEPPSPQETRPGVVPPVVSHKARDALSEHERLTDETASAIEAIDEQLKSAAPAAGFALLKEKRELQDRLDWLADTLPKVQAAANAELHAEIKRDVNAAWAPLADRRLELIAELESAVDGVLRALDEIDNITSEQVKVADQTRRIPNAFSGRSAPDLSLGQSRANLIKWAVINNTFAI